MLPTKVLILGCGGSGKSTLARRLSEASGLPVIHLDAIFWKSGWRPTPSDEWRETIQGLLARDSWIMDGNYGGTLDLRLSACDAVVFIDLPRSSCIAGVLRRWLQGKPRSDIAAGCPERLNWGYLTWVWRYRRLERPRVLAKLGGLEGRTVVILQSRAQVERFLEGIARVAEAGPRPATSGSSGVARNA